DRSERERLNAPAGPFTSILLARKPHLKGSATISEPVFPGAGIIVQRSVEVNSTNSFQEALLQKPFFYPHERGGVVFHSDHNGCRVDKPMPKSLWHGPQIDTYAPMTMSNKPPAANSLRPVSMLFKISNISTFYSAQAARQRDACDAVRSLLVFGIRDTQRRGICSASKQVHICISLAALGMTAVVSGPQSRPDTYNRNIRP